MSRIPSGRLGWSAVVWLLALMMGCGGPVQDTGAEMPLEPLRRKYLLINSLERSSNGRSPGADIDAIELWKFGEGTFWAERVLAADLIGDDNEWTDATAVLGEPDSGCEAEGIASLGGYGGHVWVDFGDDIWLENGDELTVHELGRSMCPDGSGSDDSYELAGADELGFDALTYFGTGHGLETVVIEAL